MYNNDFVLLIIFVQNEYQHLTYIIGANINYHLFICGNTDVIIMEYGIVNQQTRAQNGYSILTSQMQDIANQLTS